MFNFDIPQKVSIRNNRLVIRTAYEEFCTKKAKSELQVSNEVNLKENAPKGIITRKIRLKMQRIIGNFIHALSHSPVDEHGFRLYLPTFVTLTLPCEQMHTDKDLHAKALNPFITSLSRKHGVEHYLWRAERQANGNLHYHILIDKYIHHKEVRMLWNQVMSRLGYLDKYRQNQEEWHKHGFKVRTEMLATWDYDKQFMAWWNGRKENWSNPNSTDIHSLRNIDDVESYICKYATKSDEHDNINKLHRAKEAGTIDEDFFNKQMELVNASIEKNKINGRIWGCSDSLRDLKDCSLFIDTATHLFIEEVTAHEKSRVVNDEDFTIVYNNEIRNIIKRSPTVYKHFRQHHLSNFHHLYKQFAPPSKEVPSISGEPYLMALVKKKVLQLDFVF